MKISIVVNFFNPSSKAKLQALLNYCLACLNNPPGKVFEILVVDGSGHKSITVQQICEEHKSTYLPSRHREGFAATYNRGLASAVGDVIVLLASDVFVTVGWETRLIAEMKRTGAWMVAPYLSYSDYRAQIRSWVIRPNTFRPNSLTFNLNMLTRSCYETVGELDETLTGNFNDIDYLHRINRAGGKVIIADAGEIVHCGRATLDFESDSKWATDRQTFYAKYPEFRRFSRCDGTDPVFCSSDFYALLLKTFGLVDSRVRLRFLRQLSRLEPLFHRL